MTKYVGKMMKVFGLYEEDISTGEDKEMTGNLQDAIAPYVTAISQFRDLIKEKADLGPRELFKLCD